MERTAECSTYISLAMTASALNGFMHRPFPKAVNLPTKLLCCGIHK